MSEQITLVPAAVVTGRFIAVFLPFLFESIAVFFFVLAISADSKCMLFLYDKYIHTRLVIFSNVDKQQQLYDKT